MNKNITLKIVQTAFFIAILTVFQYMSKSFGQIVTGSLVNFTLVSCALLAGPLQGITVAAISPFLAFLLGIGPAFIQIVPFVALGNIVIVAVYSLIIKNTADMRYTDNMAKWTSAFVSGAVLKFRFLYFSVVKIVAPLLFSSGILKEKQLSVISASFSFPQLITAFIGGILAVITVPQIAKAIRK